MAKAVVLERCKNDRLLIKPGRNRWIVVRTDRDGVDVPDMVQTLGAFLLRVLGRASPQGMEAHQVLQDPDPPPGALAAWYIGAARPVVLFDLPSQKYPVGASGGKRLGRSIECKAVRLVKADNPWHFVVEFDWRGPSTWAPWPASHVSNFGIRSQDTRRTDLDWLVTEAYHLSDQPQAPDSSLGREITKYGKKKAEEAGKAIKEIATAGVSTGLVVAGVAAVLLFAYGYSKRGSYNG